MKVDGDVFGGDDRNPDAARQVLGAGVDHVALALKDALGKYQHCPDDGLWKGRGSMLDQGGNCHQDHVYTHAQLHCDMIS